MSKRTLFIYTDFQLGGVQTQIFEQCNNLNDLGFKPGVLILTREFDKDLVQDLNKVAEVFFLDEILSMPKLVRLAASRYLLFSMLLKLNDKGRQVFSQYDAIHVANLIGYLFVNYRLLTNSFKGRLSFGLYHSGEIIPYENDSSFNKYLINMLRETAPNTFISTGAVTQGVVCDLTGCSEKETNLLKMGVPIANEFIPKKKSGQIKLLSIGRLVEFKTYNEAVIRTISELISDGLKLKYTIIGDGPNKSSLELLVKELGIQDSVRFLGSKPYNVISEYIDLCDCFIGGGTALIQSAGRSCPSIIGIDSNRLKVTYGYLHKTKGQYIQEEGLEYDKTLIKDIIMELVEMDNDEYQRLRIKEYERAKEFSLMASTERFVDMHNNLPKAKCQIGRIKFLVLYGILLKDIVVSQVVASKKVSKLYE